MSQHALEWEMKEEKEEEERIDSRVASYGAESPPASKRECFQHPDMVKKMEQMVELFYWTHHLHRSLLWVIKAVFPVLKNEGFTLELLSSFLFPPSLVKTYLGRLDCWATYLT